MGPLTGGKSSLHGCVSWVISPSVGHPHALLPYPPLRPLNVAPYPWPPNPRRERVMEKKCQKPRKWGGGGKNDEKCWRSVKVKKFAKNGGFCCWVSDLLYVFFLNLRCCCSFLGRKSNLNNSQAKNTCVCVFFWGVVILKLLMNDRYGLSWY